MEDTLERAWSRIAEHINFNEQPVWFTTKLEPFPEPHLTDEAVNELVPVERWEFRQRLARDLHDGRVLKVVFGRLSTDDEWRPIEKLPPYIQVGDWR